MYAKHFIGMLNGLVALALIGLGVLVMTNVFAGRDPLAGITPSLTNGSASSTSQKTSTAKVVK
jgi:hypothetical protein